MSQIDAEKYIPTEKEVCISITAPKGEMWFVNPAVLNDKFEGILRLEFSDTLDDPYIEYDESEGISNAQADELVEFILNNSDVDKIVLHCFAGISRSRSIAQSIIDSLKLDMEPFTVRNSKAYNTVMSAFERKLNESQEKAPEE